MHSKGIGVVVVSIFIFLTISQDAHSQNQPIKNISNQESMWLGYISQVRLTNQFGLWTDLHVRMTDQFTNRMGTELYRVGATYYFTDNVRASLGYAHIRHHLSKNGQIRPEHRPWQQIQWFNNYHRASTTQWFRFEQRYLRAMENGIMNDDFDFSMRFRYNFNFFYPLTGNKIETGTPFTVLNNELHINMGNNIVYNYFDQNRFFVGLGYQLMPKSNIQVGYMNLFQQMATGNDYNMNHTLRIFLFHNFDLRSGL